MTTDAAPPLHPCPFCGCTRVVLKDYGNDVGTLFSVWCPECDQHGPTSEVESTCRDLWNARQPLPSTLKRIAKLESSLRDVFAAWCAGAVHTDMVGLRDEIRAVLAQKDKT